MNLDFAQLTNAFKKSQNKTEVLKEADVGVSRAINYFWNQYPIKQIDFNSFTLEDAKRAFDEWYYIPNSDEEIEEIEYRRLESNMWVLFTDNESVVAQLFHANKNYEYEDDFI